MESSGAMIQKKVFLLKLFHHSNETMQSQAPRTMWTYLAHSTCSLCARHHHNYTTCLASIPPPGCHRCHSPVSDGATSVPVPTYGSHPHID